MLRSSYSGIGYLFSGCHSLWDFSPSLTSFNTVDGVPGGRVSVGLLSSLALSVVR